MASNPGQIPAGGKDKISVVVGTANKGGHPLTKRFRVYTNDPSQRETVLSVSGMVNGYIDITPDRVRLVGRMGESLSQKVRIIPQKDYPFTIKEVKARSGENIRLAIEPEGKKPPKEGYLLTVTSTRKDEGSFGDFIVVQTNLKEKPTIGIPVSGRLYNKSNSHE